MIAMDPNIEYGLITPYVMTPQNILQPVSFGFVTDAVAAEGSSYTWSLALCDDGILYKCYNIAPSTVSTEYECNAIQWIVNAGADNGCSSNSVSLNHLQITRVRSEPGDIVPPDSESINSIQIKYNNGQLIKRHWFCMETLPFYLQTFPSNEPLPDITPYYTKDGTCSEWRLSFGEDKWSNLWFDSGIFYFHVDLKEVFYSPMLASDDLIQPLSYAVRITDIEAIDIDMTLVLCTADYIYQCDNVIITNDETIDYFICNSSSWIIDDADSNCNGNPNEDYIYLTVSATSATTFGINETIVDYNSKTTVAKNVFCFADHSHPSIANAYKTENGNCEQRFLTAETRSYRAVSISTIDTIEIGFYFSENMDEVMVNNDISNELLVARQPLQFGFKASTNTNDVFAIRVCDSDGAKYECEVVPDTIGQLYLCTANEWTIIKFSGECVGASHLELTLVIENISPQPSVAGLEVDQVQIIYVDEDGTTQLIKDGFCVDNSVVQGSVSGSEKCDSWFYAKPFDHLIFDSIKFDEQALKYVIYMDNHHDQGLATSHFIEQNKLVEPIQFSIDCVDCPSNAFIFGLCWNNVYIECNTFNPAVSSECTPDEWTLSLTDTACMDTNYHFFFIERLESGADFIIDSFSAALNDGTGMDETHFCFGDDSIVPSSSDTHQDSNYCSSWIYKAQSPNTRQEYDSLVVGETNALFDSYLVYFQSSVLTEALVTKGSVSNAQLLQPIKFSFKTYDDMQSVSNSVYQLHLCYNKVWYSCDGGSTPTIPDSWYWCDPLVSGFFFDRNEVYCEDEGGNFIHITKDSNGADNTIPVAVGLPNTAISWSDAWDSVDDCQKPLFDSATAWCAGSNPIDVGNVWLQIDLGTVLKITAFATKGRGDAHQWVTKYSLSGSTIAADGPWTKYGTYDGNTDRSTVVKHVPIGVIEARYIRFYPLEYHIHASMRVELYVKLLPSLDYVGHTETNLLECQGDCDRDNDCVGDLLCFQRGDNTNEIPAGPPGCAAPVDSWRDYCYKPDINIDMIDIQFNDGSSITKNQFCIDNTNEIRGYSKTGVECEEELGGGDVYSRIRLSNVDSMNIYVNAVSETTYVSYVKEAHGLSPFFVPEIISHKDGNFVLIKLNSTWYTADSHCKEYGYHGLATIFTDQYNTEANELCDSGECWIGAYSSTSINGRQWFWLSDGAHEFHYSNWANGAGDQQTAVARMAGADGTWIDEEVINDDSIKHPILCDVSEKTFDVEEYAWSTADCNADTVKTLRTGLAAIDSDFMSNLNTVISPNPDSATMKIQSHVVCGEVVNLILKYMNPLGALITTYSAFVSTVNQLLDTVQLVSNMLTIPGVNGFIKGIIRDINNVIEDVVEGISGQVKEYGDDDIVDLGKYINPLLDWINRQLCNTLFHKPVNKFEKIKADLFAEDGVIEYLRNEILNNSSPVQNWEDFTISINIGAFLCAEAANMKACTKKSYNMAVDLSKNYYIYESRSIEFQGPTGMSIDISPDVDYGEFYEFDLVPSIEYIKENKDFWELMIASFWGKIYVDGVKRVFPTLDLDVLKFNYLSPFLKEVAEGKYYSYKLGLIGETTDGSISYKCGGMRISTTNDMWNFFSLHISRNTRDEYDTIKFGAGWIANMYLGTYDEIYQLSSKALDKGADLAVQILKQLSKETLKFGEEIAVQLAKGSIIAINEIIGGMNEIACALVWVANEVVDTVNHITGQVNQGKDKCKKKLKGLGKLKNAVCGLFPIVPSIKKIQCSSPVPKIKKGRRRLADSVEAVTALQKNFESITEVLHETEQSMEMLGEYVIQVESLRMQIIFCAFVILAMGIGYICLLVDRYRIKKKGQNMYAKVSKYDSDSEAV